MPSVDWKTVLAAVLCAAACSQPGLAQVAPSAILEIDVENLVEYQEDVSDLSKFAADSNTTMPVAPRNFYFRVGIGDIVAVNGQPVQGTVTRNIRQVILRTAISPGQAIADTMRNGVLADSFEILTSNGTPIGTIVTYGNAAGSPPLGAPLSIVQGSFAIVGGTGAFLGARGQYGVIPSTPTRGASITEDPASRRLNGGGRAKFVLQVIPMSVPGIVIASGGSAIFHSDFTPVTAAKPAKAGEILIVQATGLGPTAPGVNPGQPFPTDALQQVNSPVVVTVNGQTADVINKIGWPGLVNTYRVDFRVPDGTKAGTAAIQLTAAWIAGSAVNIPTQ